MRTLSIITLLVVMLALSSGWSIWDRADFNFFKGAGGENGDLGKLNSTALADKLKSSGSADATGDLQSLLQAGKADSKSEKAQSAGDLSAALQKALAG